MVYLRKFYFVPALMDELFINDQKLTCYDSYYPYGIFPGKQVSSLDFSDITILYGSNGSGKTTMLNMIASALQAERVAPFNRTNFWDDYIRDCDTDFKNAQMEQVKIITSDDVFDYMLDVRSLNEGIHTAREDRFQEFMDYKYHSFKLESIDQVEELRKHNRAKSKTLSKYVRGSLMDNIREYSNGESAFRYFAENIKENGIYILDEPENSLSPEKQLELIHFIESSARFFGCQFIISSHSPFILSMDGALVYDLDQTPVQKADWHQLKNVRIYHDFFKKHEAEF